MQLEEFRRAKERRAAAAAAATTSTTRVVTQSYPLLTLPNLNTY
jgi:hypothetical protein